jgi:hypothetical protein
VAEEPVVVAAAVYMAAAAVLRGLDLLQAGPWLQAERRQRVVPEALQLLQLFREIMELPAHLVLAEPVVWK